MYLTKETKAEIFAKHGGKAENTGSAEGQIALFTFAQPKTVHCPTKTLPL